LMYDLTSGEYPKPGRHLREPFLHKKSQNWCVCVLMRHMSSAPEASFGRRSIRNGLNLTDPPIPRGYRWPGRRPHVPSSKPTMSKSRRASSPGSSGSGHRLYRPRRGAKRTPTFRTRPRPLA